MADRSEPPDEQEVTPFDEIYDMIMHDLFPAALEMGLHPRDVVVAVAIAHANLMMEWQRATRH